MSRSEPMTMNRRVAGRRRGLRGLVSMLLMSLGVLLIGWSALWVYARSEAGRTFDRWIGAERLAGRRWTCPGRTIDGYPLAIVVACKRPTFANGDRNTLEGELAGLRAEAKLYFPTNVKIDLLGPLMVKDQASGIDATVGWSDAHLTLRGTVPGDLDRGQLEASGLIIAQAGRAIPTRIGAMEIGFKPVPVATADGIDAEVTFKVDGGASPDADAAFGTGDPLSTTAVAVITRVPTDGATLAQALEAWRRAGGRLQFRSFAFGKGSFTATGSGHLGLDDDHRVEGRLDVHAVGLEPIAARFGIPVGAVALGGVLSGLLGGSATLPTPDAGITLPVTLRSGRLSVGPIKTGVTLPPVY